MILTSLHLGCVKSSPESECQRQFYFNDGADPVRKRVAYNILVPALWSVSTRGSLCLQWSGLTGGREPSTRFRTGVFVPFAVELTSLSHPERRTWASVAAPESSFSSSFESFIRNAALLNTFIRYCEASVSSDAV